MWSQLRDRLINTAMKDFVVQIIWSGKTYINYEHHLLLTARSKPCLRERFAFCLTASIFHQVVHLPSGWPLTTTKVVSVFFHHSNTQFLQNSSINWRQQLFRNPPCSHTRLGLLRHSTLRAEQLLGLNLSSMMTDIIGLPSPYHVSHSSREVSLIWKEKG